MKTSEKFNKLWASLREANLELFFNTTGAFAELLNSSAKEHYCFSSTTKSGAEFLVFGECQILEGAHVVPNESDRKNSPVTILLMWGMDTTFLDDLTTWGHQGCPYKVEGVPYEVFSYLNEETESNYWALYDALIQYKEKGIWNIPSDL